MFELVDHRLRCRCNGGGHCGGAAEVVALQQIHAQTDDGAQLGLGLNALGDELHTAGVRVSHNVGDDLLLIAVGWSAQCVTDHKTKKPKLPFPQSWAGQPREVIEQKSGIEGISFCHASRFLITAKDKETALAACRQVLKNNGRL